MKPRGILGIPGSHTMTGQPLAAAQMGLPGLGNFRQLPLGKHIPQRTQRLFLHSANLLSACR